MAPQVIRMVTRIFPVNETPDELSNLVKPTEFGEAIPVERRNVIDPRSGREFLMETFFCIGKLDLDSGEVQKEIDCSSIPGLVSASSAEDLRDFSGGKFVFSVPKVIAKEKVREVLNAGKEEDNSAIKIHIDLKKIRESCESSEQPKSKKSPKKVPTKEVLIKPLMRYFVENECLICGKILAGVTRRRIRSHMTTHLARKGYRCRRCRATFPEATKLYTHMLEEEEAEEYRCDRCEETFKRKHLLTVHCKDAHPQVIPSPPDKRGSFLKQKAPPCFSCSVCSESFTTWKSISGHQGAHPDRKQSYLCLICHRRFPGNLLLRYHSHVHIAGKRHACNLCSKVFPTRFKLLKHKRGVHAEQKKHQCTICGKKFNFRGSLRKHAERMHASE